MENKQPPDAVPPPREPTARAVERFDAEGGAAVPGSPTLESSSEQATPVAGASLSDLALRDRTVIAADGQAIGTVAALHFDRTSWMIQQVEVKLHRDIAKSIGEKPGMFHAATISVPTSLIQSVGDAVVLSVPTAELRSGIPQASIH